jgi:hypothetical protein
MLKMPPPYNPFRERNQWNVISFIKFIIITWTIFTLFMSFHFVPQHHHEQEDESLLSSDASEIGNRSTTNKSSTTDTSTTIHVDNAISKSKQLRRKSSQHHDNDTTDTSTTNTSSMNNIHGTHSKNVVAYAVSFIKCGDKQTHSAGLVDASLILRHSIHQISSRNPSSGSKYDYKMYAIVHEQAKECSARLQQVGFEIVVVKPPIQQEEIQGDYLRKTIHKEWCCGPDEFVKLYAYTLPHDIIVHVDIDFAFYRPMDHLFDAILYEKDSVEGKKAREMLELERPGERLPDKIGAFITRDWPQVVPGKFPPAYQAGFLVARRDPTVMTAVLDIIKEGNYTDGWGYGY